MPSVSIIIPAFNIDQYLEQAVMSALRQTLSPIEILIIDNNSSDQTLLRAHDLSEKYPLIRVLREPRQGAPFARNLGLAEAKGEWIQFLDGDDLLLPQKLEYQLGFAGPGIGFIAGAATDQDIDGTETTIPLMQHAWKGLFTGGGHLGYTSSNLWNTKALRDVDGWDTSLTRNQEYELMFQLLIRGYQAAFAPRIQTIKQKRPAGQITSTSYADYLLSSFPQRYRILQYALDHPDNIDDDTIRYFLKVYYRLYSRLRTRRPDYAVQVRRQFFDPIITLAVIRKYPLIRYLRFRSVLYVAMKEVKRRIGRRGFLGKFFGRIDKT